MACEPTERDLEVAKQKIRTMWPGKIEMELIHALAQIEALRRENAEEMERLTYQLAHHTDGDLTVLPKTPEEIPDSEIASRLEYGPTCGCIHCYWSGYIVRLRGQVASLTRMVEESENALWYAVEDEEEPSIAYGNCIVGGRKRKELDAKIDAQILATSTAVEPETESEVMPNDPTTS